MRLGRQVSVEQLRAAVEHVADHKSSRSDHTVGSSLLGALGDSTRRDKHTVDVKDSDP